MGDARVVWMLATICSLIANTSADGEGKTFVYRKSTGGFGQIGAPDPTMMRPEDFLPNFGGELEPADDPQGGKGMSDAAAADFVSYLLARGATDTRKPRRDAPREP